MLTYLDKLEKIEIDKNYKELDGLTPIMFAARYGLNDYLGIQIKKIDDEHKKSMILSQKNPNNGLTALHLATMHGHVNTVKLLLLHNASPLIQSGLNQLPIHLIFNNRNTKQTSILLFNLLKEYAGTINQANFNGDTIAHIAASKGNTQIINHLKTLPNYQGFGYTNNQGRTPLLIAILNNNIDAAKLLMEEKYLHILDNKNRNALHYAVLYAKKELCELLLSKISPNDLDEDKNSALDLAKEIGDIEKINILETNMGKVFGEPTNNFPKF